MRMSQQKRAELMGQWVHVPDGHTVLVTPSPTKLYPAVGGPDELTNVLDQMAANPTGNITVIDLLDNDKA